MNNESRYVLGMDCGTTNIKAVILSDAGESSGTSSLVFVGSLDQSEPDVPVVTRPSPIDGIPWVFDAPITTTGASLKWFIEKLAGEERTCQGL